MQQPDRLGPGRGRVIVKGADQQQINRKVQVKAGVRTFATDRFTL